MNFKDCLRRTNLECIAKFIITGEEYLPESSTKSLGQRFDEADEKITALLDQRFPDVKECDEFSRQFNEQAEVLQDVYLQVGILIGAKLSDEIKLKWKELA